MSNISSSQKLEMVFHLYEKPLYYFILNILKEQYLSEDAVQNTFIKILKNIDKIHCVDSKETKSYIYTIARNTAIDILRKNKTAQNATVPLDENVLFIEEDFEIEKAISEMSFDGDIGEYVESLDEVDRHLLYLKYARDAKDDEIADILNLSSSGAARQKLYLARKKLAALILQKRGDDNG